MLLFLFTLFDFLALVITVISHYNLIDSLIPLALAGLYMFFKGVVFMGDISSFIDLLVGIYLVMMLFGVRWKITLLVVLWFMNKIVAAFVS